MKKTQICIWIVQLNIFVASFFLFFFWWFINGSMIFLLILGLSIINLCLTPIWKKRGEKR